MTEPKPTDRKFYEKSRNVITGDRLVSKAPTKEYKSNYDKIKWGVKDETERK